MNDIRAFAVDLAERAVSTFVQTFASVIVGTQLTSWGEVKQVASAAAVAGGAAVLALLKGVAGGVRTGTASLSKTATTAAVLEAGHVPASAVMPSVGVAQLIPDPADVPAAPAAPAAPPVMPS